jgi:folate-binding protein YgfZ
MPAPGPTGDIHAPFRDTDAYQSARARVASFDLSARTKLELRGADRASFLHNFCTNEIKKLPTGEGCEAYILSLQARILARILVFARPDALWIDAEPGLGSKLHSHLDRFLITEQVELHDRTEDWGQLFLVGPGAGAVVEMMAGPEVTGLRHLQSTDAVLAGVACQMRRNDSLGLPGFELLCPKSDLRTLGLALQAAGVSTAPLAGYEILRVEAGIPEYGKDIDETNLPQEVGRDSLAISFTKGCYLGQEPVVRIRDLGHVNRMLVGLRLAAKRTVPPGTAIHRNGQDVGKVTSSVISPLLDAGLILAYLRRGHQTPGTLVSIPGDPDPVEAEVVRLPFTVR